MVLCNFMLSWKDREFECVVNRISSYPYRIDSRVEVYKKKGYSIITKMALNVLVALLGSVTLLSENYYMAVVVLWITLFYHRYLNKQLEINLRKIRRFISNEHK